MKEFGSDFHRCDHDFHGKSNYFDVIGSTRYYACGRHAIDALVANEHWKRIWIPAYFCYEVIKHIAGTGIEVKLYDDTPLSNKDDEVVRSLPYENGDVLIRINFFGLRGKHTNKEIPVPVIEDHTHGLVSQWALHSDADWCIASLRKSLPVATGGILWSPEGKQLPKDIKTSDLCEKIASIRYEAMEIKKKYLKDGGDKNVFREKYLKTEEMIDGLSLSGIDKESKNIAHLLNIKLWIDLKRQNWQIAYNLLCDKFNILRPNKDILWYPFSLIILCDTEEERERLRKYMIQHNIYSAILWQIPDNSPFVNALDISKRMLSVHCDIRYSKKDIEQMCNIINGYYDPNNLY